MDHLVHAGQRHSVVEESRTMGHRKRDESRNSYSGAKVSAPMTTSTRTFPGVDHVPESQENKPKCLVSLQLAVAPVSPSTLDWLGHQRAADARLTPRHRRNEAKRVPATIKKLAAIQRKKKTTTLYDLRQAYL